MVTFKSLLGRKPGECIHESWVNRRFLDRTKRAGAIYKQEHWRGQPLPSPGDLPGPEIEPGPHQGSLIRCLVFHFPLFFYSTLCILGDILSILRMLLLLSRFSRVQLYATPYNAAHQAPLSLGFSRWEHWSGLPFPSPMHESEKWKWSHSVASNPQRPRGPQPTRLLRPWDFPGKSTGVRCHCLWKH